MRALDSQLADDKRIVHLVAARVRQLRRGRGESGQQLANHLGISQQQLAKNETGVNPISIDRLWQIAEHYRVDVYELIGDLGASPEATTPMDGRLRNLQLEIGRAVRGVRPDILRAVLRLLETAQPETEP